MSYFKIEIPMSLLRRFSNRCICIIDAISEWIGKTISWLTLLMVLITFLVVSLRYAFDIGWIAMQESVGYMNSLVFMLGAAYTLKNNQHVRVDIFYQGFSTTTQAWINCLGTLLLLFPVCFFIIFISWEYIAESWRIREGSQHSGGLPGLYLLKSSIIAMAVLLILQGLSIVLSNLLTLLDSRNQESD